jgi:hypothetical protein
VRRSVRQEVVGLVIIRLGALLVDRPPPDALKLPAHIDSACARIVPRQGSPMVQSATPSAPLAWRPWDRQANGIGSANCCAFYRWGMLIVAV